MKYYRKSDKRHARSEHWKLQTLIREIKDLIKWRGIQCSWMRNSILLRC